MSSRRSGCIAALIGVWLTSWSSAGAVHAQPVAAREALRRLESVAGGPLRVTWSKTTGVATFVGSGARDAIAVHGAATSRSSDRARAFLDAYGQTLGLPNAKAVTVLRTGGPDHVGMEHVRLQQVHKNIPGRFGEITIHMNKTGVVAVLGKTVTDLDEVDTTPTVSATAALATATQLVREHYGRHDADFSASTLELINRGLLDGTRAATRLAWFTEARAQGVRALVWVDAQSGQVLLHVNQLPDALARGIYDLMSTPGPLPGTPARFEGQGPTGNIDVDGAYDATGDTYNYYLSEHGRDSFDNAGATMTATVHYCDGSCGCPCFNAFWNGAQTVFGNGFAYDDFVGHEWTHGVTQYTADLIYFEAAGAMNESFSDIFGETVDLTNGTGYDPPAARWRIGESPSLPGGIRNMMNPGVAFFPGPGKMSDPELLCTTNDNGGVHTNSAIGNHAYALMVDGGTYNGHTIAGIGLQKAGKIEYRALSEYLTSASGYPDDYDALQQACADLIGTVGITSADCDDMKNALDAVEMYAPWPCRCGNGVIDADEECDDGNRVDGDCCSAQCLLEPNGSSCTDGNVCTINDQCDGAGACTGVGPAPNCVALIPGGGKKATDCAHEWVVLALTTPNNDGFPPKRIMCTEDDPTCDFGGVAGDHICTFHVGMCLNEVDPRLLCTPTQTENARVLKPGTKPKLAVDAANRGALEAALVGLGGQLQGTCTNRGAQHGNPCTANTQCDSVPGQGNGVCKRSVAFQPPLTSTNTCTGFVDVNVPLRRNGTARASKGLRLSAKESQTNPSARTDTDGVTLVCKPHP